MDRVHIDFETLSASELPKQGASKYSKHPSTDIMCLGIGWNDEPAKVMGVCRRLEAFDPADHASHGEWLRLLEHIQSGGLCIAHNVNFELAIWNNVGVKKYGWPELKASQTDCTMARAYAMSLPGSLDGARAAVGLTVEKDQAGHRLMLKLSKPRSTTTCPSCLGSSRESDESCCNCNGCGEVYTWHEDPEDIKRLFDYCQRDIDVERALDKRLKRLSPSEKKLWLLDYEINGRGMMADVPNAIRATKLVDAEEDRLDAEMRVVTSGGVATCKAHVQLRKWINNQGVEAKGVGKNDIPKILAQLDLPAAVHSAIAIRQEAAKSSTAKLKSIVDRACTDQRLRGMFQFHGANTGRWAARGVQLHNFPRKRPEWKVFELLERAGWAYTRDYIDTFLGSPIQVISDSLRGFLMAGEGRNLFAVDFNSIEARVTAWLAGQESILEIFRTHAKIYEDQAAKTFRVPIEKITKDDYRRQIGKVMTLAFGFGGGVGALQAMCRAYGVKLEPVYEILWALAHSEQRERAIGRYKSESTKAEKKGTPFEISKKEWLASELAKVFWRAANPDIVSYWSKIETAAIRAFEAPGKSFTVDTELPPIQLGISGTFLLCKLPSKRVLCYPYPDVSMMKTEWGGKKTTLTYKTEVNRKWIRVPTYGGSLTENVVQAVARDLLAEAMLRVDENGHRIVMHVHDEIVTESTTQYPKGNLEELISIVEQVPAWASGLPITAEGWYGSRYRK